MKLFFNKLKSNISVVLNRKASQRIVKRYYNNDTWAIITGCTSGIGKSYAEILYQNNFNLILISRNEEKLKELEKILYNQDNPSKNNHKKILKIVFDFSDNKIYDQESYDKYLNEFSKLDINLIVNNVGETTYGGEFYKHDIKKNLSLINVNINSNIFITKLFIDSQLIKDNKHRKGIINISSYFGIRPVPGNSVYSSSKAFISNFSSCLFYELKNIESFTVDILCLNPLFVKTKMVNIKNKFIINPEDIVYASFRKINGYKVHSYGHSKHFIQAVLLNFIPNFIFCRFLLNYFTSQYNKIIAKLKLRIKK